MQVTLLDNVKEGMRLFNQGSHLLQGGFSFQKIEAAEDLYAGATNFFRGMAHSGEHRPAGLDSSDFANDYRGEQKTVTMFSGCRDEQTSADANIGGVSEGAMSWAFLQTMRAGGGNSYMQTLQQTRFALRQSHYQQLSVGYPMDLNVSLEAWLAGLCLVPLQSADGLDSNP